jgi:ferredoxin-type protein NapH|tara:strand:+ start:641 stop:2221 length:1581 start_codon:yes stop_codon:yes gene_type:complete
MKSIRTFGLGLLLAAFAVFISILFVGQYKLSSKALDAFCVQKNITSPIFINTLESSVIEREFNTPFYLANTIAKSVKSANIAHKKNKEWSKVIWEKPHSLAYQLVKSSGIGVVVQNKVSLWFLSFGLAILGALLFMLPAIELKGPAGIKNNHIFHKSATNRGWIAWLVFMFLVGFYIVLYFRPSYMINWIYLVDPISESISGHSASQWFLYGFLYCVVMAVMAVRMYIKYRNNKYQVLRTTSVLFFQIVFAFLIPEILVRFEKPWYDFKNIFPLDYDFFFRWNLDELLDSGGFGLFVLVWGVLLTVVIVPVMVYFFGKRWYCSWVCGCGGLAETLGDPYRQLSSKSLFSWKVERWLVHGVLVFALVMTGLTLYGYFSGSYKVYGIKVQTIQDVYGFLIGSIFAGVIGTGLYPIFGNRVWCRFGCPLAAYMGVIQRFKSKFRITTNGGQCISCGNCSTYCEQGIDVRAYAQKGENIVRSSCVGCGICSAVCPRGVLKLENGPEQGRIGSVDVLLGNDMNLIDQLDEK